VNQVIQISCPLVLVRRFDDLDHLNGTARESKRFLDHLDIGILDREAVVTQEYSLEPCASPFSLWQD
jgi:hypothetical protein